MMGSRPAELAMLVASIDHLGEGCGGGVECPSLFVIFIEIFHNLRNFPRTWISKIATFSMSRDEYYKSIIDHFHLLMSSYVILGGDHLRAKSS